MSEQLVSSVPSNLLLHLAHLDEECQSMPPGDEVDICRGPFGAFKASLRRSQSAPAQDASAEAEDGGQSQETLQSRRDLAFSPSDLMNFMPVDNDLIQVLESSELDLLPSFANFSDPSLDTDTLIQGYSDTFPVEEVPAPSKEKELTQNDHFSEPISYLHRLDQSTPSVSIAYTPSTHNAATQDVVYLMQHFSTTVLTYLTPIRHEKGPWHILFLPHMRNCLALLTLGQPIEHADMCTFQGLLAISALSMGGAHQSQMWLEQGLAYKQRAFQHCATMLEAAYDLPKRYKYKSVLMALQIAILISTLGGDPATEEYYFLETEKFIKLKGLGRKNSRKVRLLHRCYAFERLIYESTCMRGIDVKHRHHVCNHIKSVSVVPYPEDGMAFRLPDWHNLDEQISKTRNLEDDEANLEDEALGLWPDALCSKISGLPEHWILLILHVILLGKQKDAVEQSGSSDTTHLQEFLRRAKTLENCINQHVLQPDLSSLRDDQATDNESALENVLDAIRHSLQIYFYRRIYEVEALWLQDKVVKVRDCLLRCEAGGPTYSGLSGCVGVLWASFIASCEAEDPEVQRSFSGWYTRAAQRTGMSCWTNSLTLSEQLWSEKRRSRGRKVTWIDFLKEHRRQMLRACCAAA